MINELIEYGWFSGNPYHKSSRQLTLTPYRRSQDQAALPNDLTRLPLEIQYMIYGFLIGDAKGKTCCEESFGSNIPRRVPMLIEANEYYYCHTSQSLVRRAIHLKYRIPTSASPQFMLTSYDLYKIVNPLYRAICVTHIQASWRDIHRLPDIVPGFAAHVLRKADIIINDKEFGDWANIAYFHPDIKPYPNLKELNVLHTYRDEVVKVAEISTLAQK